MPVQKLFPVVHNVEVLLPHGPIAKFVLNDFLYCDFAALRRYMAVDILTVGTVGAVPLLMKLVADLSLDLEGDDWSS